MQYRVDPRSGNQLSLLGFGMMRLPRGLSSIDQEKTTALVKEAVAGGVNYFDTAYIYPGSEVALGRALAETGLRDQVFLATKLPHQRCSGTEDFDRIFDEQLARLQTDRIDYYLVHNLPSPAAWRRVQNLGIEQWLENRRQSGQIGQIGFSFHGSQDDFMLLLDAWDFDFVQIQYNYLDVNYQAGQVGLKAAAERNLMVVVMEPLRGGKLATGLPKQAVARIAESEEGLTPAALAFAWLYGQSDITVVLSGMGNLEQLQENLVTASRVYPEAFNDNQRQLVDQVIELIQAEYRVACTGCNYCMPCAYGVNIPDCFMALNTRITQGAVAGWSQYFSGIKPHDGERYSGPGRCRACRACESKCPQGLNIVELLAEVKRRMEPTWMRPLLSVIRGMAG